MRSGARARTGAAVGAAGLVVLLAVAPDRLGLAGTTPLAQAVALRGLVATMLVVAGLGIGLVAVLLVRGARAVDGPHGARQRSLARALGSVAVLAILGAVVQGAVLADRGTTGVLGPDPAPAARPGDVVVLVQNTLGRLDAEQLATLVVTRGADVVVLPETTARTAEQAGALVAERTGRELEVLAHAAGPTDISSTALLVDRRLGTLRVARVLPGRSASFVAAGADGTAVVTAVHSTAPVGLGLGAWRDTTTAAVATCGEAGIVAGDFNATLDHPAMSLGHGCRDTALQSGTAGVGTWPVVLPRAIGAPIDHVLVDPSRWTVVAGTVLDPPSGTDHRAVEAVLRPVTD